MRLIPDGPVRRERATGPSALRWQPIAGSETGDGPGQRGRVRAVRP